MSGYVHVYTGNGKGKTTAAMGLALRAAGAGWNVFIAQFGKPLPSSEVRALQCLSDRVTVRRYGPALGSDDADRAAQAAHRGLAECKAVLTRGDHALVILDEANIAPLFCLFSVSDLLELIDARAENVELVLTGRYAAESVIRRADLVTEMRQIKHYYQRGVLARTGIEQ